VPHAAGGVELGEDLLGSREPLLHHRENQPGRQPGVRVPRGRIHRRPRRAGVRKSSRQVGRIAGKPRARNAILHDIEGRDQDASYSLGATNLKPQDQILAGFLTRRGLVPPSLWKTSALTLGQGLQILGKLWQELEPVEMTEGTLLRDGQIRVKNGGPGPLSLAPALLLVEEAPGGSLRLVTENAIQVGDRVRWLARSGGSRLLIRRLDPDGASLDRYNPTAHWKQEVKEAELLDRLQQKAGIKSLKSLEVQQNEHGRVLELTVRDGAGKAHRFTGMRIRGLLGLKDNVFGFIQTGTRPTRRWIFYGRGWGHGVGMDQTGAYGYALEGWTYDQILKHYFKGIELKKVE